mgnify:CR=1 FL=1
MRYLCMDVGGTSIKYGIGYKTGKLSCLGKTSFGTTLDDFLDTVKELYERIGPTDGVAACFPGEVHSEEGVIRGISAVEQLHNHPIRSLISDLCGCPVTMLNDANAAALGELWQGVGKQYKNIAFVIVGTGVGGAVIENGRLYPGSTCNKAEIGNFLMGGTEEGRYLTWSDFTLEHQAQKYSAKTGNKVNGQQLYQLSEEGQKEAAFFVEEFLHYMAVGCVSVAFAYDPQIIAVGGGISQNPDIIRRINETYENLVKGQRMGYLKPKIVACQQKNHANLLGALYYFLTGGEQDEI